MDPNPASSEHPAPSAPTASTFPPLLHFRASAERSSEPGWTPARLALRIRGDTNLLLAVAVALPVFAVEGASNGAGRAVGLLAPLVFIGAQVWLTTIRNPPAWLQVARLAFCLSFIVLANLWVDIHGSWPLSALAVPVIALAAAIGGRGATVVAIAGMAFLLVPLAIPGLDPVEREDVFSIAMAAVALAYGSRRVVANLERSSNRLRLANLRARRRARQLAAVETVGSLLAREGLTGGTLDRIMGVLEYTFGYQYPSVYTWDGSVLRLGAQRNYANPIEVVSIDKGVIGRAIRRREAIFLPDARSDPAFLSADPAVVGEIAVPLQSDGELFGVLNIETSRERPLDEDDFATMQIVGDRLAAALALGRERQKLTERTALLDRLTTFATALGSSLDPATMDDEVAIGAARVIAADSVVLVNLDDAGRYVVNGIAGGDPEIFGAVISPTEGISGQTITSRSVTVNDRLERKDFPKAVTAVKLPDALAAMAAPMVTGDRVIGLILWLRGDLAHPFTTQEREIAGLLAGKVGLALANARLHQRTADAAITDPLTGLRNRRHFDSTMEHDDAVRRRIPAEKRRARSAILFDLDHFGQVNKRYGHQIGDRVLRLFSETLGSRSRASDLVARYGGEEFVVILEDASRDDAIRIAEEVRTAFAKKRADTTGGEVVRTTVSAGCSTLEPWEVEGSLLLERADVALAMAKQGGRNQVVAA